MLISFALVILWMTVLGWHRAWSEPIVGAGATEYVRVAKASLRLFCALAIITLLFRATLWFGFILISFSIGVAALILVRWFWRRWLIAQRAHGEYTSRVLLVGSTDSVAQIAREFERNPGAGLNVVGACTPCNDDTQVVEGTQIARLGGIDSLENAIQATAADTIVVTSADELPPQKVKQISWTLEGGRQHLVLAPSIVDIAGSRLHTLNLAGLPLIHLEIPRLSPSQRVVKRLFDVVVATVFLVLLSPVIIVVAIALATTSKGPVFYTQERIGLRGEPFKMFKFRSMRTGADVDLQALLETQGASGKPLFKVKDDPRITPVGKFIRKYSLDELPQLLNVLGGSMSLVGPRPQIAAEVALYNDAAHRRLLARPGLTGLWQVSGRSNLDWEDAMRLDLYYVENWSPLADLAILLRTVKAVMLPGGSAH